MREERRIIVGPHFAPPPNPKFAEGEVYKLPDNDKVVRSFRQVYDWKSYSPSGLAIMERYWDSFVACAHVPMLPDNIRKSPSSFHGVNLGTFNGAYQKAWIRNGYQMFGVEIADIIDELNEYGCEGIRSSIFDMSGIESNRFDFAVLDRTICTPHFYDTYDGCYDPTPPQKPRKENVETLMTEIFRILKPGGALIGILYAHYSLAVVQALASRGLLRIWPTYTGLLGFCVVNDREATHIPSIFDESPTQSTLFRRFYPTDKGIAALYLPSNQIAIYKSGGMTVEFAPRSPHWGVLSR